MSKITITTIPPPPGLYEDKDFVLNYLIVVLLAHLAVLHPDKKRTRMILFNVNGAWHLLMRNHDYTSMRVMEPCTTEQAMSRAQIVADECPNAEVEMANPELVPEPEKS